MFVCYRNTSDSDLKLIQTMVNLDECMINGKIYLTDRNTLKILSDVDKVDKNDKDRIRVKNGFATLNDKFFIIDDYDNKEDKNVLCVCKASNCEMHYFFYPYDENGKPMIYDKQPRRERKNVSGVNQQPDVYVQRDLQGEGPGEGQRPAAHRGRGAQPDGHRTGGGTTQRKRRNGKR